MGSPAAPVRPPDAVRRRRVFYIGGFDPQGPARYHAMVEEGAAGALSRCGLDVQVSARRRAGAHLSRWRLQARTPDGETVDTVYDFARWDDLVRAAWPRARSVVLGQTLAVAARLMANGSGWRILQTSWPAALLLLGPGLALAVLLMFGLPAVAASLWAVVQGQPGAAAGWAVAVSGLGIGWWALHRMLQGDWLMRSAHHILRCARGRAPDLEARIDAFAAMLGDAADEGWDEVLVVGHSSGCMLAISAVARALPRWQATGQRLSFLTLGHCVPLLSYQPEAVRFRQELSQLRSSAHLDWVDVTAPPDGCCFALTDPTAVCDDGGGAASLPSGPGRPKCLSPRWMQAFSAAHYAALRRDKMRCHFQYLRPTDAPTPFDPMLLTAGPLRLGPRFANVPGVTGFRAFQRFGSPAR